MKRKNQTPLIKKHDPLAYHLMLIPGVIMLIIFNVIPLGGIVIAFQKFVPAKGIFGSKWVGLQNIMYMFQIPDSKIVFQNTLVIACVKIILGIVFPVVFALLLNEVRRAVLKRTIQTAIYLPYFLSWVICGSIIKNILAPSGPVNQFLTACGLENPIMFLSDTGVFRQVLYVSEVWKTFGYGTIIYLAALTSIDPTLYEAAAIDGAGRMKQLWHITLPGLVPTIILLATLSLGNVLNAGFDQIFNLYNPLVYEVADVIDTYVYRAGLVQMQFSLGSAVGLMKSIVGIILMIISHTLAYKYANYRIF